MKQTLMVEQQSSKKYAVKLTRLLSLIIFRRRITGSDYDSPISFATLGCIIEIRVDMLMKEYLKA